ncbi:MAG: hypothetical protein P9L99_01115 [Candidatus Lernaella stagnicola]|nr:hypothetical protein [Candidatus Lernaella stagnicola]
MTRRCLVFGTLWLMVMLTTAGAWAADDAAPETPPLDSAVATDAPDEVAAPVPVVPPLAPPVEVVAADNPSDAGGSIVVKITPSPDEYAAVPVVSYIVERAVCEPKGFQEIGLVMAFALQSVDEKGRNEPMVRVVDADTIDGTDYFYRAVAVTASGRRSVAVNAPLAQSSAQWFAINKLNMLLLAAIISAAIIFFIEAIRRGKKPYIRKIAGLEAVDEAIGRATEMGRPILFIPGINDMNDVQTVSSIIILGRIARTIAEYDTRLMVPNCRSLVMTTARETVKEAYAAAGRPDAYSDDMITYLTDEQFGYVAGVNGIMVREKPATCFYLGAFFAESLILAETGNSIGAIQIAGTAMPSQLPFFIAACDYTLIGEELFAASAYLSQEPKQLGSLKGQDLGKAIAMLFIVGGGIAKTVAVLSENEGAWKVAEFIHNLFKVAN